LNTWLEEAHQNFFVFYASTMLYGLHKRVSPQPWVLLTADHSFLRSDIDKVSATVVEELKRNHVTVIVLEHPFENERLLKEMPSLNAWLHREFRKTKTFGGYQVWTANTLDHDPRSTNSAVNREVGAFRSLSVSTRRPSLSDSDRSAAGPPIQ
jgi:hypothetical protein